MQQFRDIILNNPKTTSVILSICELLASITWRFLKLLSFIDIDIISILFYSNHLNQWNKEFRHKQP